MKCVCAGSRIVPYPFVDSGTVGNSYLRPNVNVSFLDACHLSETKKPSRYIATPPWMSGPGVTTLSGSPSKKSAAADAPPVKVPEKIKLPAWIVIRRSQSNDLADFGAYGETMRAS